MIEVAAGIPPEVVDVYREAFGASPYFEGETEVTRFADEVLPRHAGRDGFRCVVAREEGTVVGFAYGYTSAPASGGTTGSRSWWARRWPRSG